MTADVVAWLQEVHASALRTVEESQGYFRLHPEQVPELDHPIGVLANVIDVDDIAAAGWARVAAERAILAVVLPEVERLDAVYEAEAGPPTDRVSSLLVAHLASGWRHMPGYRQEWAP